MGTVVTSGNLGGVMVSTLVRNVRDVGSIPALDTTIPISITPATVFIEECSLEDLLPKETVPPPT